LGRYGKKTGTTGATSRGVVSRARKTTLRPIGVREEIKELKVRWYTSCLVPRREQAVCEVVFVVFSTVVLATDHPLSEENLDATPRALVGIGVGPGVRINEVDAMVYSAMRVIVLRIRLQLVIDVPPLFTLKFATDVLPPPVPPLFPLTL
jgi:hypothetical protein